MTTYSATAACLCDTELQWREDALAAVGTLVGLGQKPRWNDFCEEQFEVKEALLTDMLHAAAEGSQAGAPRSEERCIRH